MLIEHTLLCKTCMRMGGEYCRVRHFNDQLFIGI